MYLLQAVLKINTKLLAAKMGRRTFEKILIAVVLKRRQTRPKLYRDREENNIVIRTKVDITITVCQMINYQTALIVLLTWKTWKQVYSPPPPPPILYSHMIG